MGDVIKGGGWVVLVFAVLAWYHAAADVIAATFGRNILPVGPRRSGSPDAEMARADLHGRPAFRVSPPTVADGDAAGAHGISRAAGSSVNSSSTGTKSSRQRGRHTVPRPPPGQAPRVCNPAGRGLSS